jgi:periplasmic protein TonB
VSALLAARRQEELRGSLVVSVLFHIGLALFGAVYVFFGLRSGVGWGDIKGGAIRVSTVSSLPGVPLPHPPVITPSRVVTENPGRYHTVKPQPPVLPPPNAIKIPRFKNLEKIIPPRRKPPKPKVALMRERQLLANPRIQKHPLPNPENAIPTGGAGTPEMQTGQKISVANTTGKMIFNGGGFGNEYGWYVQAVQRAVEQNWLLSTVDPSIAQAPRVYVEFDILRNGTVSGLHVTQSSGFGEVDRSAERAVLASNPFPALPPAYHGNDVHVILYFDYHR